MNTKEFITNCQRTSAEITPEVLRRLTDAEVVQTLVWRLLEMKSAGNELDILKKHIFYGKAIDPDDLDKTSVTQDNKKETMLFADKPKLMHGIIGIGSEYAELLENLFNDQFDKANVAEELGDLLWYIIEVMVSQDLVMGECMWRVVEKLKVRFPEKFTEKDAAERKDKLCHPCLGTGVRYHVGSEDEYECGICNGTGELK